MDLLFEFLIANQLYSLLLFSVGFGCGYIVCEVFVKKPTISNISSVCNVGHSFVDEYHKVARVYKDDKLSAISCNHIDKNQICSITKKECYLLNGKMPTKRDISGIVL